MAAQREIESPTNVMEIPSLVYRLCTKLTGNVQNAEEIKRVYDTSYQLLRAPPTQLGDCEEFYLISKIKEKLSKEFRDTDGLRLEELYWKLKRSPLNCRHPIGQLEFLYRMSSQTETAKPDSLHLLNNGLVPLTMQPLHSSSSMTSINGAMKGLQSIRKPYTPMAYDIARLLPTGLSDGTQLNHFVSTTPMPLSSGNAQMRRSRVARPHTIHIDGTSSHFVTEHELIREILFAFQGLNGKIINVDSNKNDRFTINSQYNVPASVEHLALRLTNMGWLFNKIQKYCNYIEKDKSNGNVCQSFASALQEEILEYYRLIAVIEEQLHNDIINESSGTDTSPRVTLLRLQVWCFEPFYRLKYLSSLIEQCKNKKGGSLASIVYHNMQHGDPQIKNCLTRILNQVVLPIRRMLSHWIFHGELEDNYKEFFITTNRSGVINQTSPISSTFWHEKYIINRSMLPGFITKDQANKILSTGKAIYMLRQVCRNEINVTFPGHTDLKTTFESTNLESLFNYKRSDSDGEFQILLDTAHKEISKTSLRILRDNFRLFDHFRGLRQYMLLGQGDFIRHLMDVLSKQLDKPSDKIARHTVVPRLELAVRSTNAQYDDPEITNRIDVRLKEASLSESGWDVFTLAYRIDGPINTIFTTDAQQLYERIFRHLWRSKRVEYVLTNIWKYQNFYARYANVIPELKHVYHSFHILLSEMTHFIQQMEYYFTFDVLECEWTHLQTELNAANDVDCLIKAHGEFLENVIKRSFLGDDSIDLFQQYRTICDIVIEFQSEIEKFWKDIETEVNATQKFNAEIQMKTDKGQWGIIGGEDKTNEERRGAFVNDVIPKARLRVMMIARTYQDMVQKYLVMLADHSDRELQELSARLDFNEHYKKRDKRLETSFTYGSFKQRLSNDPPSSK